MNTREADRIIQEGKIVTVYNSVYRQTWSEKFVRRDRYNIYGECGSKYDRAELSIVPEDTQPQPIIVPEDTPMITDSQPQPNADDITSTEEKLRYFAQVPYIPQPQPQPITALDCKSDLIRAEFSKLFPRLSTYAIIEWRDGLRGYGYYVTIPQSYDWELYVIVFFYDDFTGGFELLPSGTNPQPQPDADDIADYETIICEQIALDAKHSAALCADDNGEWVPTAQQIAELGEQYIYWRDQLENALGENSWARINYCNMVIWAIQGILGLCKA